jgi:hypothetical protein
MTSITLMPSITRIFISLLTASILSQCSSTETGASVKAAADCVVSVKDQKIAFYKNGILQQTYGVSTSKFGLSDKPGNYGTPLGLHEVVAKIGHGAPAGAVFHSRQWTGEIIKPNAPGRDPIVSRIMWLQGLESRNKNAYGRCIYIHGTAEEAKIGQPASYGCIRMKSKDVIDLFNRLPIGARVLIAEGGIPVSVPVERRAPAPAALPTPDGNAPLMLNPNIASANAAPTNVVAQNTASSDSPENSSYQSKPGNNESTIIYSATNNKNSPAMVLKSKRRAAAQ